MLIISKCNTYPENIDIINIDEKDIDWKNVDQYWYLWIENKRCVNIDLINIDNIDRVLKL